MTTDLEKRVAIEQHWAASEAGHVGLEHRRYAEDAVLDYPQSGERFVGRSIIAEQRNGNFAERHFTLRRVLGAGPVWVSECVITYDGVPTISVSITEFDDGVVAHETQFFADPFNAPASRARLAQRIDPGSRALDSTGHCAAGRRSCRKRAVDADRGGELRNKGGLPNEGEWR